MKRVFVGWCMLALSVSTAFAYKKERTLFYNRPSGDVIIRWGFQSACDHVYDLRINPYVWPTSARGTTFDPDRVQAGDCIFARQVDRFFKEMHPRIKVPYILITHGEHLDGVEEKQLRYLDDEKVIAWFGIHPCQATHPKFKPLPLGILQDPQLYKKLPELEKLFVALRNSSSKKSHLLYMNFADNQKPERKKLKKMLHDAPYCKRTGRKDFREYLKTMAKCTFTLAPRGLGPDSYRMWESLLVGSIPVIKSSSLDPLLKKLPVLIVSEWEELSEEFLEEKYKEITSKRYDIKRLYMNYWLAKIQKTKNRFLESYK